MGVYIPNMEKPARCKDCPLVYEDWGFGRCCLTDSYTPDDHDMLNPDCPLKSTKELILDFESNDSNDFWKQAKFLLGNCNKIDI
jgi:hypothetical protein